MKLKLPSTNLSYVVLNVKYTLNGEECACNMHMLNDNKMYDVEIDTPDGGVVTTVTMNEITDAQKVVSSQVLYDAAKEKSIEAEKMVVTVTGNVDPEPESKPTESNLKVATAVTAKVEHKKKGDHASAHSKRETKNQSKSGGEKESKEEKT